MEEAAFCERLSVLFALVSPQKPEKGIRALLARARALAEAEGIVLSLALEQTYEDAEKRTHARLQLLGQCKPGFGPTEPEDLNAAEGN